MLVTLMWNTVILSNQSICVTRFWKKWKNAPTNKKNVKQKNEIQQNEEINFSSKEVLLVAEQFELQTVTTNWPKTNHKTI